MKRWQIESASGLNAMKLVDVPEPTLRENEVLIEMKAWSLNYRDLGMPRGGYYRNDKVKRDPPLVPLSDGAGVVIAVGNGVTRFKVGDRVTPIFFQTWLGGELEDRQIGSALGGAINGVLSDRVVLHEDGLVNVPEHLSYAQAACLPCAAVTAWQALTLGALLPGHRILTLGTGGVSIFGLQFAKLMGASVIVTSSSDEKLARAKQLGADAVINYRKFPEWSQQVLEMTGGTGVDNVIEVGGAGTLEQSMQAVKVSGQVSLIGVLTGNPEQNPSPMMALFKRIRIQGIYVGSRDMFQAMNRAIELNKLEPVIDRSFAFEEAKLAYEHLMSAQHFGKVVIEK